MDISAKRHCELLTSQLCSVLTTAAQLLPAGYEAARVTGCRSMADPVAPHSDRA